MPDKPAPTGFGTALHRMRSEKGMTQKQLADAVGLSLNGYAKLERGEQEPGWPTVLALAAALGVDCRAFQAEGDEPPPPPAKPGRPKKVAESEPLAAKKGKKKGG